MDLHKRAGVQTSQFLFCGPLGTRPPCLEMHAPQALELQTCGVTARWSARNEGARISSLARGPIRDRLPIGGSVIGDMVVWYSQARGLFASGEKLRQLRIELWLRAC